MSLKLCKTIGLVIYLIWRVSFFFSLMVFMITHYFILHTYFMRTTGAEAVWRWSLSYWVSYFLVSGPTDGPQESQTVYPVHNSSSPLTSYNILILFSSSNDPRYCSQSSSSSSFSLSDESSVNTQKGNWCFLIFTLLFDPEKHSTFQIFNSSTYNFVDTGPTSFFVSLLVSSPYLQLH